LPFEYHDESVEVACSGNALKKIIANINHDPYTAFSVIKKASVFARMAPEDKAILV